MTDPANRLDDQFRVLRERLAAQGDTAPSEDHEQLEALLDDDTPEEERRRLAAAVVGSVENQRRLGQILAVESALNGAVESELPGTAAPPPRLRLLGPITVLAAAAAVLIVSGLWWFGRTPVLQGQLLVAQADPPKGIDQPPYLAASASEDLVLSDPVAVDVHWVGLDLASGRATRVRLSGLQPLRVSRLGVDRGFVLVGATASDPAGLEAGFVGLWSNGLATAAAQGLGPLRLALGGRLAPGSGVLHLLLEIR